MSVIYITYDVTYITERLNRYASGHVEIVAAWRRTHPRDPGSFGFAQDFACGLRRPQNGSTSLRALDFREERHFCGAPFRMTDLDYISIKVR
jgi:hypothetical protein